MTGVQEGLVGLSATELAGRVRAGSVSPVEVVAAHLARISEVDEPLSAFQVLRREAALAEASELSRREGVGSLPLAGVPVAIKDNIDVAGEPTRHGCPASPDGPAANDSELVKRLRAAGAIVVGKTRVPQFCMWPFTDSAFGITRSAWDPSLTAGGSSGGSATAVASGMVPVAQGSDGGGSIRIPAACCGIFGIKPGRGTVPAGRFNWYGLSERGPLATTVDDAALVLSVLAGAPGLAQPSAPDRSLRLAVSVKPTFSGAASDPDYPAALHRVADCLAEHGHSVEEADPEYGLSAFATSALRAFAGMAQEASALGVHIPDLERRARPEVIAGYGVRATGLLQLAQAKRWKRAARAFFDRFDVLLTPTLAAKPVPAENWWQRSWLANMRLAPFAPYTSVWNACGYPAAAVPVSAPDGGFPLSVQLVAAPGGEGLLLSLAKQIETLLPWQRHAPLAPTAVTAR